MWKWGNQQARQGLGFGREADHCSSCSSYTANILWSWALHSQVIGSFYSWYQEGNDTTTFLWTVSYFLLLPEWILRLKLQAGHPEISASQRKTVSCIGTRIMKSWVKVSYSFSLRVGICERILDTDHYYCSRTTDQRCVRIFPSENWHGINFCGKD